jgi:hypothetical protein
MKFGMYRGPRWTPWEQWFAWYPIRVNKPQESGGVVSYWMWWERVERRTYSNAAVGVFYSEKEYRLLQG